MQRASNWRRCAPAGHSRRALKVDGGEGARAGDGCTRAFERARARMPGHTQARQHARQPERRRMLMSTRGKRARHT
eukprot:1152714-Pleurochrysis_carterae.AAC.1